MINENTLAKYVCEAVTAHVGRRGEKVDISIAQVKLVLSKTFELLATQYAPSEILAMLEKRG